MKKYFVEVTHQGTRYVVLFSVSRGNNGHTYTDYFIDVYRYFDGTHAILNDGTNALTSAPFAEKEIDKELRELFEKEVLKHPEYPFI